MKSQDSNATTRPQWPLATVVAAVLIAACGGPQAGGIATITEGPALGPTEPERGVPPHVAPRLDAVNLDRIDQFVIDLMLDSDIPGMALGIVSGTDVIHLRGFGVADDAKRPVTPDTPFLLTELSQTLTAFAIMQLAEDGVIDIDAPVRRYLPWFTTSTPDAAAEITLRHLLNHQSGFSARTGLDNLMNSDSSDTALEENVRRLADIELANPLGYYEMSNINYDILGLIVQTVDEQPFEQYLEANVLGPLDMRHTHLSENTAEADGKADGFYPWFGTPRPTRMPYSRSVIPSVSIFSTVEDISHLLISQLNNGEYRGARVLTAASVEAMHRGTPYDQFAAYGMGWNVRPLWDAPLQLEDDGVLTTSIPTIVEQEGSYPTYSSYMAIVPEGRWGFVALVNTNDELAEQHVFPFQSITQLILGEEPTPQQDNSSFLGRNIGWMLAVLVGLQIAAAVISWLRLRRWRRSPVGLPEGGPALRRYVLIPAVADLVVAYLLLVVLPSQADAPLYVTVRSAPDLGVLVALGGLLALGWGTVRTVVTLITLFRKRPTGGPSFGVRP